MTEGHDAALGCRGRPVVNRTGDGPSASRGRWPCPHRGAGAGDLGAGPCRGRRSPRSRQRKSLSSSARTSQARRPSRTRSNRIAWSRRPVAEERSQARSNRSTSRGEMCRWRAPHPGVEAGTRDREQEAHPGDRVEGLLRIDEYELHDWFFAKNSTLLTVAALYSSVNLRRLRRSLLGFPSSMSDTVSAVH